MKTHGKAGEDVTGIHGERERECVCVCEREQDREIAGAREYAREKERWRQREKGRVKQREHGSRRYRLTGWWTMMSLS